MPNINILAVIRVIFVSLLLYLLYLVVAKVISGEPLTIVGILLVLVGVLVAIKEFNLVPER